MAEKRKQQIKSKKTKNQNRAQVGDCPKLCPNPLPHLLSQGNLGN